MGQLFEFFRQQMSLFVNILLMRLFSYNSIQHNIIAQVNPPHRHSQTQNLKNYQTKQNRKLKYSRLISQMKTAQDQATDKIYTQVICSRCNRPPQRSQITGRAFVTYLCYEDCGNVFWTLRNCVKCNVLNYTKLTSKPKTGELITCKNCHSSVYYFRCPSPQCKKLMVKDAQHYRMGEPTACQYCSQQYKLVVCPCGGQVYLNAKQLIYEGVNEYNCKQCESSFVYVICPECNKPSYPSDKPEIGEKIKCTHCKQTRYQVPCPGCGRSGLCKTFHYGEQEKCMYCGWVYEFILCPNGCGMNCYFGDKLRGPYRKCERGGCNLTFLLINCDKCHHPLYIQDYEFGYWREEECPACKYPVKFHLCQCGLLNKNMNKCINPTCAVPKQCRNYSKQWKQQQKQVQTKKQHGDNYNAKQCKLCYDLQSCMVNETCRHMMMCETCYKYMRTKQNSEKIRCPICKQPGKYHLYVDPILS